LITAGIIATVFSIMAILVSNFWWVLTWRAILGLSLGFCSAVCPIYSSAIVDDSVKGILLVFSVIVGRVASTLQLFITFFILIGEVFNYLFVPSFDSEKCVPLTPLSWKMQIGFSAVFGVCLIITLLFGPNPKRMTDYWF